MNPTHILYVVGFMGCGKTTLAHKWAEKYHGYAYDLDQEIEKYTALTIAEIFESRGEEGFRQIEKEVLHTITAKVAESSPSGNYFIATGGGAPCFFDNFSFMKEHGSIIFLDTPFEVIYYRLFLQGNPRPLLKKRSTYDSLYALYLMRLPLYLQADIILKSPEIEYLESLL